MERARQAQIKALRSRRAAARARREQLIIIRQQLLSGTAEHAADHLELCLILMQTIRHSRQLQAEANTLRAKNSLSWLARALDGDSGGQEAPVAPPTPVPLRQRSVADLGAADRVRASAL